MVNYRRGRGGPPEAPRGGFRQAPRAVEILPQEVRGPERSIPARLYRPLRDAEQPPLPQPGALYFQGGGFVSGDLDTADQAAREIALRLGVTVLTVAYSLAPTSTFPAAAEDAFAALNWLADSARDLGLDAARLVVCGSEAGGNLAAVAALMARDRGGPSLTAQVLVAPMLDPCMTSQSMREHWRASLGKPERWSGSYRKYLPHAADRVHPYAAPCLSSRLRGLPPALILTAEHDPLRDEGEIYGAKLIAAGVKTLVARHLGAALDLGTADDLVWRDIEDFLSPLLGRPRRRNV